MNSKHGNELRILGITINHILTTLQWGFTAWAASNHNFPLISILLILTFRPSRSPKPSPFSILDICPAPLPSWCIVLITSRVWVLQGPLHPTGTPREDLDLHSSHCFRYRSRPASSRTSRSLPLSAPRAQCWKPTGPPIMSSTYFHKVKAPKNLRILIFE